MKVELWHKENGFYSLCCFSWRKVKAESRKVSLLQIKQIFLVVSLVMHEAFLTCTVRPAVTQERDWPVYRADRSSVCRFAPPIESRVIFH